MWKREEKGKWKKGTGFFLPNSLSTNPVCLCTLYAGPSIANVRPLAFACMPALGPTETETVSCCHELVKLSFKNQFNRRYSIACINKEQLSVIKH